MNYCKTCTAPTPQPESAAAQNDPFEFVEDMTLRDWMAGMAMQSINTRASATLVGSPLHNLRAASWIKHWN